MQQFSEIIKNPQRGLRVPEKKLLDRLSPVVTDGFDGAAFFSFLAARFLLRRLGLFVDVGIAAVFVAFEIIRSRFAAQVAINALVVYVILTSGIFGIFICDVCHNRNLVWRRI